MRLAFGCLLLALPALAQLDSAALRAKYGPPLHRETFRLPRGFNLIVDYGAGNQVCKLEVPAEMPAPEGFSGAYNPKQDMQNFLLKLVPDAMRGKELSRNTWILGGVSRSHVIYEHVMITESNDAGREETVTVQFLTDGCR